MYKVDTMSEPVTNTMLEANNLQDRAADTERETVISVDHVSMVFNMASERLTNLKEYFLKAVKHELFFEELKALDDISFEVKKGDVFGIIGTNGSGKSTMLKIIAGVLSPTQGSVSIKGQIAPLIELGAGFDMDLSARENIYLNGALLGYSKDFIQEHFDQIVEFAEIERFLDMPMKNYSSGMVARIAFAIATVIVPEILIVDEVLSVGDFMFQKKCEDRITELIEQHGVTVIIVSHSNDQIARLCNKAIWIEKGRLRLIGNARMLTKVYQSLAGGTGSTAAETHVFNILERSLFTDNTMPSTIIEGALPLETNVSLVRSCIGQETCDEIAIAVDTTHVNAALATSFAGAKHIPVIPTQIDSIPDCILGFLNEKKPRKIWFFDLASRGTWAKNALDNLAWKPMVIPVGADTNIHTYTLQAFEYGLEIGLWNSEAILVRFEDNLKIVALLPLLYRNGIPVIMFTDDSPYESMPHVLGMLADAGIEKVTALSDDLFKAANNFNSGNQLHIDQIGHDSEDPCFAIMKHVACSFAHGKQHLQQTLIATQSNAQWVDLISAGYYCSEQNTSLMLINMNDFASLDRYLRYLEDSPRRVTLVFVEGLSALESFERSLFTVAASQAQGYTTR